MAQPPIPQESAQGAMPPGGEQGAAPQGGKLSSAMSEAFKNLSLVEELLGAAGQGPMAQKVGALKQQFEALLDDGGAPEEQAPPPAAPGGPVPMMAGAAKARPVL